MLSTLLVLALLKSNTRPAMLPLVKNRKNELLQEEAGGNDGGY